MQGFLKRKVQSYASQKLLLLTLFLFFTSQTFYAFGQDGEDGEGCQIDNPIRFTLDRQRGVFIDANSICNSTIVLVELQKVSFQEYRTEIRYKVFPEGFNDVFQVTLIQQKPGGQNFTTTIPQSKDQSDRYQNLFDESFPWLDYCLVPQVYDPTSSLPNNYPRSDSKKDSIFVRCQNSLFLQITVAPPYNKHFMNQFELHLYMVQLSYATNTYTPIDLMPDGKQIVYLGFFDQSVQEPSTLKWPIQPYNNQIYFYNFYYLEQLGDWYDNMRFFTAAINTSQVFCIARQGVAPTVLGRENIYTSNAKGVWGANFSNYDLMQLSKRKKESPGQIEIIQLSTKKSKIVSNIAFVTLACKTRENAIDPYITIRGDVSILEYRNKPDSQKNPQFKNITIDTDVQNKLGLQKSDYYVTYLIDYNSTFILKQPQNKNKTIQDIALNQLQLQLYYLADEIVNNNNKYQMRFCRIASYSHLNVTNYDEEGRWSVSYETFESSATLLTPSQCEPYTTGMLQLSNIQDGLFTIIVTAQQGQEKVYPFKITISKQFDQKIPQND